MRSSDPREVLRMSRSNLRPGIWQTYGAAATDIAYMALAIAPLLVLVYLAAALGWRLWTALMG